MKISPSVLKPALMLVIFCVVITAALALTNAVTADRIAELQKQNTENAMREICQADAFEKKTANDQDGNSFTYYEAKNGAKTICYLFVTSASGYGGEITLMTGILPDGGVQAVTVLDATSETAGLGQNVQNPAFLEQFCGKQEEIGVVKYNAGNAEINAVTGATISSKAAARCVNQALERFELLDGKGRSENE